MFTISRLKFSRVSHPTSISFRYLQTQKVAGTMDAIKDAAARMTGHSVNGFSQEDVTDLHGRTALVTGGTEGIGFEVAKALALARARVLLLARKEERAEEAVAKIKQAASTGPVPDITFVSCDLGCLQKVKTIADNLREHEPRLDLLICDAGIGVNKYGLSSDGIDRHMAVNHLGHFLLINRLLPLLRKTAHTPNTPPPRIISVASELHRAAPASVSFGSLRELNDPSLSAVSLYGRSKLANILFTKYGLAERVLRAGPADGGSSSGDRILAFSTHPGAVHTGQQDQFKEAYGALFGTLMKYAVVPFMRAPDQGSLSTLWAATSDDVGDAGWGGSYFTQPGVTGCESRQACDPELGRNLWELSESIVKEKLGEDALLPWDEGK